MNPVLQTILSDFVHSYISPGFIVGFWIEFFIVVLIISIFRLFPKSNFVILCDYAFELVYNFFEDLLGKEEKNWIKMFVSILFFIIIFSNLLGVLLEFISPIFGESFEYFIQIPTADINFNIAMAVVGISIVIYEQFSHLGFGKFLYEYFPIFGKGYVPYKRGKLKPILDIPLFIFVKIFDIIISLFLGVLEIIGLVAKIISLSFRLFGNITSGGILLVMLMGAVGSMSISLLNFEFPILIPLIVYAQEIMVACIQAFVFPLLIAIFIKVAKLH